MSLTVNLADGINPGRITPDSLLRGTVTLELPKQKTIANAKIIFTGKIVTEFSEIRVGSAGNTHGPRRHAIERIVLFNYEKIFFPGPYTVPAQRFEWPFEFLVTRVVNCSRQSTGENLCWQNVGAFAENGPCYLPPTFEWRDKTTEHVIDARIKYKLVASVDSGTGLFKRIIKEKIPIIITNIADHTLSDRSHRPFPQYQMRCYDFPMSHGLPQSSVTFPDRITIPYSDSSTDDLSALDWLSGGSATSSGMRMAGIFHTCQTCAEPDPERIDHDACPQQTMLLGAKLTLNRVVSVRVAPTQRLVRNVGTKMIASGGQGYTIDDVVVTRKTVLLPHSESNDPLSVWAKSVSESLTEFNEDAFRNGGLMVQARRKHVAGFKCYTISVQHSVRIEKHLTYIDNDGQKREIFPKIDVPVRIEGAFSNKIDRSELEVLPADGCQQGQISIRSSDSATPVHGRNKEQEALQERSNVRSSLHNVADTDLPRYEENTEPPPPA